MSANVIGFTIETDGMSSEDLEKMKVFSGKNAGICQIKGLYKESSKMTAEASLKRFINTCDMGHHSISDHVRIEVLFEGVSKMLAMVLNSLQVYSTSEKSGRFTEMTGNSQLEQELYAKWKVIFQDKLREINPTIDDLAMKKILRKSGRDCDVIDGKASDGLGVEDVINDVNLPSAKLAQENARYVLGIYTKSTSFGYSTDLRQWNYIADWCDVYIDRFELISEKQRSSILDGEYVGGLKLKGGKTPSYFEACLFCDLFWLRNYICTTMYVPELRDNKGRCFDILTSLSGVGNHPMALYNSNTDCSIDGLQYCVDYLCSFAVFAHLERHRTLKHFLLLNAGNICENGFFVPEFIKGDKDCVDEWLKDLDSVKEFIPCATLITVVETGFIDDFALKTTERYCGCAMWETMNVVKQLGLRFLNEAYSSTSDTYRSYVSKFADLETGRLKTKCKMIGCKNPCAHGAENALKRIY